MEKKVWPCIDTCDIHVAEEKEDMHAYVTPEMTRTIGETLAFVSQSGCF